LSTHIYVSPDVAEVRALHPYLTRVSFRTLPVGEQIAQQAETVRQAHATGDRRARMHLQSWWLPAIGHPLDHVMDMPLTDSDARLALSREYGFADWDAVQRNGTGTVDAAFEQALDALLTGDLAARAARLTEMPELARARSAYGHRSTLLHYIGANGVESHRQVTPLNATDMARLLIRHGADRHALRTCMVNGQTAYMLAQTSAHPQEAGVMAALLAALSVE
jgi:hypothetical protein